MAKNLRAVDLNLLTVFDAIYQTRSMTKAAERLHMSQPAVSLALGRLRSLLADPLFERARGSMQPTLRAQQLAGPVRLVLDTVVNSVLRQPGFDYVRSNREFNVALGEYGVCLIVPRLSEQIEQLGAGTALHFSGLSGEPAEDAMRQGTLDLFLSPYPLPGKEFHSQLVCTDSLSILASKGHPELTEKLSVERFCELRHVVADWPRAKGLRPGEQFLLSKSLRRNVWIRANSFMAVPMIVARSHGVATLATKLAQHFAEIHDLAIWPVSFTTAEVQMYLNWHKSNHADEGHGWLRNLLIDLFRRL